MLAHRALRSTIPSVHATLALAGALVLVPTATMAQHGYAQKPVPSGLLAVIANEPSQPLDLKPFSNPFISGIALQIHWSDVEPAQGKPNWARLDELFAAAQMSHKWVHLYVFPGFWSPGWALQGAVTDQFQDMDRERVRSWPCRCPGTRCTSAIGLPS